MRVTRRLRLADERGFTLPELLVAMSVGLIVLLAAFMLVDRTFSASGQIADRSDALQRGRQAMELMTRQLRSQVCVGEADRPIVSASGNSVSFYADLSDSNRVQLRTLSYNPTTRRITQAIIAGAGTYPDLTFTSPPSTTILLTRVEPVMDGTAPRAIFRYYGYDSTGALQLLGPPPSSPQSALPATAVGRVAVIKVGFRSFADRNLTRDADSTVIENDVYVRIADPEQLEEGPQCM
jgi:prepilin-type N-terminal cleavage/methylation domain-containing protein